LAIEAGVFSAPTIVALFSNPAAFASGERDSTLRDKAELIRRLFKVMNFSSIGRSSFHAEPELDRFPESMSGAI
jgi:hypothetical protein